jgi:hypothetical protein
MRNCAAFTGPKELMTQEGRGRRSPGGVTLRRRPLAPASAGGAVQGDAVTLPGNSTEDLPKKRLNSSLRRSGTFNRASPAIGRWPSFKRCINMLYEPEDPTELVTAISAVAVVAAVIIVVWWFW